MRWGSCQPRRSQIALSTARGPSNRGAGPSNRTALERGTARRRLRAAALALPDALSERPAVLFAALPSDDRHLLLALLARRLEHSATAVRLSPSGRVRAADAHSAVNAPTADAQRRRPGWRHLCVDDGRPAGRGGARHGAVGRRPRRRAHDGAYVRLSPKACTDRGGERTAAARAPRCTQARFASRPRGHRHTPRALAPCWARRAAACTERPAAPKMARSIACARAPCSP